MHELVASQREAISEICRRYDVKALEVFGSAARREDFDAQNSDIDFLVTYRSIRKHDALAQFFGLRDELSDLLGRKVDLVEPGGIVNPYIRTAINHDREVVFAG